MLIVNITVLIVSLLIIIHIVNLLLGKLKEGMNEENLKCDSKLKNDPIYLSKVNAAEIKVMKEQVGDIKKMRDDMEILKGLVMNNTKGVKKMSDELVKKKTELIGDFEGNEDEIPRVSGLQ